MNYFASRETLKTCSIAIVEVFFYHILHNNSITIALIEDLTGFLLVPPPKKKVLEKKWTAEFVVLLTEIWPKNIDFYRYSYNVGERAVPPPPFHTKK